MPTSKLPDYLNDLNSIREAELALFKTPRERCDYLIHLANVTSRTHSVAADGTIDTETVWACFSTAAQRAESLLRACGKWTDGEA